MTKVKTGTAIEDLQGKPIKNGESNFTIGEVVSNVLSGKVTNPHKGYLLAKRFATDEEVDLLAEDVAFIKAELTANGSAKEYGYTSLVIGQAIELLDGSNKEDK